MKKVIFIFVFLLLTVSPALAQDEVGLVPCGYGSLPACTPCHLFVLADFIVSFIFEMLALPILVVALLAGGVIWATAAGSTEKITQGRKIITGSIIGIFIAFGGWLIVDTIIKTLGSGEGQLKWAWNEIGACPEAIVPPPATGGDGDGIPPISGEVFQTDEEARQLLTANGVPINKGDCPTPTATSCTSLKGLPKYVATKLIQLQTECFNVCPFVVTGGTEAGHQQHGQGKPVVDIVPAKNNKSQGAFLALLAKVTSSSFKGSARCEAQGGAPIQDCKSPTNHIHIFFPPPQ